MRRRANGEGSIFQRQDSRWCARLKVDGKMRYHYAHTQRDCQNWLLEQRRQQGDGLIVDAGRLALSDFLAYWLQSVQSSLRPRTYQQYAQVIRQHVNPVLGQVTLDDLRPVQLQALYNRHQSDGQPTRTAQIIHAVLHRALRQAVRWQLLARNPADAVDPPRRPYHEMQTLSASQVQQLLAAARGDRLEALWQLAVTTGMRQGELLGLRWSDVDWERGTLQVQRQLQRVPGKGLLFVELKTSGSRRAVSLGTATLHSLRLHRAGQLPASELIFPNQAGQPYEPRDVLRCFKALLAKAGLPDMRFHDLRHTSASLLLAQNVHPKVVQERLGHATPLITLATYSHVVPGMQRQAAQVLDDMVSPERPENG